MDSRQPALVSRSMHDLRGDRHKSHSTGMANDLLVSAHMATEFLKPTLVLFEHVRSRLPLRVTEES
jgi:hypothetical protein